MKNFLLAVSAALLILTGAATGTLVAQNTVPPPVVVGTTTQSSPVIIPPAGTTKVAPQPDGSVVLLRPFIMDFNNWLSAFVSMVLMGVLGLVYKKVADYFGIKQNQETEDRLRAVLQKEIETQAGKFIAKLDGAAMNASIDVHSPGIADAANKAIANIPNVEAKLGLTPDKAADMVVGEIGKLQAAAPVVAPPATVTVSDNVVNVAAPEEGKPK